MTFAHALSVRFHALIELHVAQLTVRSSKGTGLCPFYPERTPSLSIDFDKCVFYCFDCGAGGGVKKFAELIGEPWNAAPLNRREKAQVAVSLRRREAEWKSQTILLRRRDERLDTVFAKWREASREAAHTASLLSLFHRRPDLEAEFLDLATRAEHTFGAVVFQCVLLEAQLNGEVQL